MKRILALILALVMVLGMLPTMAMAAHTPEADDNGLRMWYDEPAALTAPNRDSSWWQEYTLPLGNGTTGALVFGGIAKDRLHFNEKSLWTGGPGSVQAAINFPSADKPLASTNEPLAWNGGNRVTAVSPEALEAYRQLLDNKSQYVWGENFTNANSSGIREVVFGSSSSNPSTMMSRWQDFGDIYLTFPGVDETAATNYVRDLDMTTGISSVNYDLDGVSYAREYFVSYPDDVTVVRLTASKDEAITVDVAAEVTSADLNTEANTERVYTIENGNTLVLDGAFKLPTIGNSRTYALNGLRFGYRLQVVNEGGTLTPAEDGKSISVVGADALTLIFACDTDYANEYPEYRTGVAPHVPCEEKVTAAAAKTYAQLRAAHVADHSELFDRVDIDLGGESDLATDDLVKAYGRSMIPEQPYVNVALGATATASSFYAPYAHIPGYETYNAYVPGYATDGNTNTICLTGKEDDTNAWVAVNLGEAKTFDLLQLACVTPYYTLEYKNSRGQWQEMTVLSTETELEQDFRNVLVEIEPVTTTDIRVRWETDYAGLGNKGKMNRTLGELRAYDTTQPAEIEYIATEAEQRLLEVMAYQYGRYLTIAGSREGSLPTNLGGAWLIGSASGLWGSDYHFNINVQMNYWPTLAGNLAECATTLNDYVASLREPGRVTAAQTAGVVSGEGEANGFLVNTQNNPFGYTAPSGSQEYGWNISGSTWALQNVYEYYKFTGDVDYLRDNIYPMMKEMANFWQQFLWYSEYQDRLVVSPSVSAEQGPTVNGATYDQSFVWQHFENTIEAAEILGVDADLIETWRSLQAQLKPIQIGEDGQIKEWFEETSIGMAQAGDLAEVEVPNWRAGISPTNSIVPHRHLSHLVGLYPGTLISKDSPEEVVNAAMVSLTERGFGATSWSKSHKINSWARMGRGEESYQMLRSMVGGGNAGLMGNLFASHGNNGSGTINYTASRIFQIDGNFGLASGFSEMLIQSQLGYVQFLPAIPAVWTEGKVEGMIARGNFEIDMVWSEGVADYFRVTSHNGGTFAAEYPGLSAAAVATTTGRAVDFTAENADKIAFETTAGETYIIKVTGKSVYETPAIAAVTGETETTVDADTVAYTVTVDDVMNLATAQVTLSVEGLGEPTVELAEGWYLINQTYADGVLTVLAANNAGVTASEPTELLTVICPVVAVGDAVVTLEDASLSAYFGTNSETYLDVTYGSQSVTTEVGYSIYDVNEDGVVDQLDITRAQRAYGAVEGDANWIDRADIDDNGTVDIKDLILILNNYTA